MATVTLYKAFSFKAAQDWGWDIINPPTTPTFSQVTISDGVHTQVFKGSFSSNNGYSITGGTVTETQYKVNGALVYKVTGMSVGATKMQDFANTYGDTQATYAYVLRGNDTIAGSSGNDSLLGYNGNDTLSGNAGNDTLIGGAGKDVLTGGTGKDNFRFDKALSVSTNLDTIKDFKAIDDTIQLENAVFKKLTVAGTLKAANFHASTSGNAGDSNDYILYETDTGKLFYDADGSGHGTKVQFALLGTSSHPAITAADFLVF